MLLRTLVVKRNAGGGTPAGMFLNCTKEGAEVVNFVPTTRRWYDRGQPREMQEEGTPADTLRVRLDRAVEVEIRTPTRRF